MEVYTYYRKPLCVLGSVDTERGREIAAELLKWLFKYEVHEVVHDGSLYEQPALRYAQELSIKENRPVLYLHTKGAYNKPERSRKIRKLWRREFQDGVDALCWWRQCLPLVVCPFTGADRMTRYNGFWATPEAWKAIAPIEPSEDRMVFEKLWRDAKAVQIHGTVYEDITSENLKKVHDYLNQHF